MNRVLSREDVFASTLDAIYILTLQQLPYKKLMAFFLYHRYPFELEETCRQLGYKSFNHLIRENKDVFSKWLEIFVAKDISGEWILHYKNQHAKNNKLIMQNLKEKVVETGQAQISFDDTVYFEVHNQLQYIQGRKNLAKVVNYCEENNYVDPSGYVTMEHIIAVFPDLFSEIYSNKHLKSWFPNQGGKMDQILQNILFEEVDYQYAKPEIKQGLQFRLKSDASIVGINEKLDKLLQRIQPFFNRLQQEIAKNQKRHGKNGNRQNDDRSPSYRPQPKPQSSSNVFESKKTQKVTVPDETLFGESDSEEEDRVENRYKDFGQPKMDLNAVERVEDTFMQNSEDQEKAEKESFNFARDYPVAGDIDLVELFEEENEPAIEVAGDYANFGAEASKDTNVPKYHLCSKTLIPSSKNVHLSSIFLNPSTKCYNSDGSYTESEDENEEEENSDEENKSDSSFSKSAGSDETNNKTIIADKNWSADLLNASAKMEADKNSEMNAYYGDFKDPFPSSPLPDPIDTDSEYEDAEEYYNASMMGSRPNRRETTSPLSDFTSMDSEDEVFDDFSLPLKAEDEKKDAEKTGGGYLFSDGEDFNVTMMPTNPNRSYIIKTGSNKNGNFEPDSIPDMSELDSDAEDYVQSLLPSKSIKTEEQKKLNHKDVDSDLLNRQKNESSGNGIFGRDQSTNLNDLDSDDEDYVSSILPSKSIKSEDRKKSHENHVGSDLFNLQKNESSGNGIFGRYRSPNPNLNDLDSEDEDYVASLLASKSTKIGDQKKSENHAGEPKNTVVDDENRYSVYNLWGPCPNVNPYAKDSDNEEDNRDPFMAVNRFLNDKKDAEKLAHGASKMPINNTIENKSPENPAAEQMPPNRDPDGNANNAPKIPTKFEYLPGFTGRNKECPKFKKEAYRRTREKVNGTTAKKALQMQHKLEMPVEKVVPPRPPPTSDTVIDDGPIPAAAAPPTTTTFGPHSSARPQRTFNPRQTTSRILGGFSLPHNFPKHLLIEKQNAEKEKQKATFCPYHSTNHGCVQQCFDLPPPVPPHASPSFNERPVPPPPPPPHQNRTKRVAAHQYDVPGYRSEYFRRGSAYRQRSNFEG